MCVLPAATLKSASGTATFEAGYDVSSNCTKTYSSLTWRLQPSGDAYGLVLYSPADVLQGPSAEQCIYKYVLTEATSTILGVEPQMLSSSAAGLVLSLGAALACLAAAAAQLL